MLLYTKLYRYSTIIIFIHFLEHHHTSGIRMIYFKTIYACIIISITDHRYNRSEITIYASDKFQTVTSIIRTVARQCFADLNISNATTGEALVNNKFFKLGFIRHYPIAFNITKHFPNQLHIWRSDPFFPDWSTADLHVIRQNPCGTIFSNIFKIFIALSSRMFVTIHICVRQYHVRPHLFMFRQN